MDFNLEALFGFSPGYVLLQRPNPAGNQSYPRTINVYRKSTGKYEVWGLDQQDIANVYSQLGPNSVSNNQVKDLETVYEIGRIIGASISPSTAQNPKYLEFLKAQEQVFQKTGAHPGAKQAFDDFCLRADPLFLELSRVLPAYKIRQLTNPRICVGISKRNDGVFIWPDWRSSRFVNVVLSVDAKDFSECRDIVYDWLDSNNLRINPVSSFKS